VQGDVLQNQHDYWKNKLSGTLPELELPTDHARPPVQTYKGGTVRFAFPRQLTDALNRLSRQEGVTLFVTLLAAFNTLLLRYTGQDDIILGTPIAGRERADLEELIGCFSNTLVLRTDASGNPSFRTLLKRVLEANLAAQSHQDLPFEKLVEELHSKRDLSRSPLFQVLFSLLNTRTEPLALTGLQPATLSFQDGGAKYDLSLNVEETPIGLEGGWSYNSDLFEHSTIARMAGHFTTLLENIVYDPEAPLQAFPLLPAEEREQVLVKWNRTATDYASEFSLHELFEAQAQRVPGAIAVEFNREQLTYRELDERSTRLAVHLQSLGVAPDTLVAVCMDRSLDFVVVLLGILKAGGAYVPMDPTFPSDRLRFMLEDSQPRVVLTQTSLRDRIPAEQANVICMDRFSAPANSKSDRTFSTFSSSDLAYVLYTSGSTGKPKGVEISHRSVVNFLSAMRATPGLQPDDVMLTVTTPSFEIFGLELGLPLLSGAKVVLVPPEVSKDGARLAAAISLCHATVMQATPSTWRLLLDSGWQGSSKLKILCGGEAWSKELAAKLLPKCASLWNMYGPTETTIWSAVYKVKQDGAVFLGPPIANTTFYVVDSHFQPQPIGVPGELLIGGDGLARGYLNRPALTAEKFITDPFHRNSQSRLYRTGDLVRQRFDGNIEFLSRIDQQVKLRGFRIELGEIESVLRTHSNIRECVVVVREDSGEQELVAYIVLESTQAAVGPSDLRQALQNQLPDYMIPTEIVVLESLPLTHIRIVVR
jgi:amino acid adenylation domain-containing protein